MQMRTKATRSKLFSGRRILSLLLMLMVLLGTTIGALSALAEELVGIADGSGDDSEGVTFYKMTSLDQLEKNAHYIVLRKLGDGTYAALTSSSESGAYYAGYENVTVSGKKWNVSSLDENYVLTLSGDNGDGTYRFQANDGRRMRLNSSEVFSDSVSWLTVTAGTEENTWRLKSASSSGRALIWNGSGFAPARNSDLLGDDLEIWTDVMPEGFVDGEEDPREVVFHKMTNLAELTAGSRYIIVTTDGAAGGQCYVLTPDKNSLYTLLNYGDLPYEPEEDVGYMFTLSEGKTNGTSDGTWYFKTDGYSLKLNSKGVFDAENSPGHVTVSKSGDGWALSTANRSLIWYKDAGYFGVSSNNYTPGSTVEIWTDAETVIDDKDPCGCSCDKCAEGCECANGTPCGSEDCTCGTAAPEETYTFHKLTDVSELWIGSFYIITYNANVNDPEYFALHYSDQAEFKYAGWSSVNAETETVTQKVIDEATGEETEETIEVVREKDELIVPVSADYILTLGAGNSEGTWRFADPNGNRLKLDSTHVFQNDSTGNIQLIPTNIVDEMGETTVAWQLRNYDASKGTIGRALTWTSTGFDVTRSNGTAGSNFVIWVCRVLEECDCSCEKCENGCECADGTPCGSEDCACGTPKEDPDAKEYEVTFKDSTDKTIATAKVSSAAMPTYANIPETASAIAVTDYNGTEKKVFAGWFEKKNGEGREFGSFVIEQDMTFYPHWITFTTDSEDLEKFHKITNVNEIQVGAHYIIVVPSEDGTVRTFAALPSNDFIADLLRDSSVTGTNNSVAFWKVHPDVASVLEITDKKGSTSGTVTVEIQLNDSYRMKLGTSSSLLTPLFNAGGGSIQLAMVGDTGLWSVSNSGSRYLWYSEEEGFYAHYKNAVPKDSPIINAFEIWTDASALDSDEDPAKELFVEYLPLGWDLKSYLSYYNYNLTFVYTAEDGTSYALMADEKSNAMVVVLSDLTVDVYEGGKYVEKDTSVFYLNPNYTWSTNGWTYGVGDTRFTTLYQSKNKAYLKLEDGLFGAAGANLTFVQSENGYTIHVNDSYLGWDSENKQFTVTDEANAIDVSVFGPSRNEISYTYARVTDLEQLKSTNPFVVVVEVDGKHYAIGYDSTSGSSQWLLEVELNSDGTLTLAGGSNWYHQLKHGALSSYTKNSWTFESLSPVDRSTYWRPQQLGGSYTPWYKSSSKVRFAYGDDRQIYLRGNASDTWLNVAWIMHDGDLKLMGTAVEEEYATPVEIYTILLDKDDLVEVNYHDVDGEVEGTVHSQGSFALEHLPDVELIEDETTGKLREVKDDEKGTWYIFLGWTTQPRYDEYQNATGIHLTKEASANLFDFVNDEIGNAITEDKKIPGFIGNGDWESITVISDLREFLNGLDRTRDTSNGGTIELYPVYAVRGTDDVVTATDEGTQKDVIGISDWKSDQKGNHRYQDPSRERWLGSIDIEIFKDGVQWIKPTTMYFSYHNDNTVDLNIKFIWDHLVEGYAAEAAENDVDPLYAYMSHYDYADFPLNDQTGYFIIDGVYASQGGSENGLYYSLNWMTNHGGQLDNVEGGSTVKVYVTTKYDAKYYLWNDKEERYELVAEDDGPYSTLGTDEAFKADKEEADYKRYVSQKDPLMEYTPDADDSAEPTFKDGGKIKRGEYHTFAYIFDDHYNVIKGEGSPEALVPKGYVLTSTGWELRGNPAGTMTLSLQEDSDTFVNWGHTYTIRGDAYGTENTKYAYQDRPATYEADSPYTFHFYADTDVARGSLTIRKTVPLYYDGETFTFTVTLYNGEDLATDIDGDYSGVIFTQGVATVTIQGSGSVTIKGLPAGYRYTVVENTDPNYDTSATGDTGVIPEEADMVNTALDDEEGPAVAAFTNTRKTGELTIQKTVLGYYDGETFTFTVTIKNKTGVATDVDGDYNGVTFTQGVATVTIQGNGSVTITGLPVGFTYEVVETPDANYTTTSTGETGSISTTAGTAAFTNTRKTGKLTVSKAVEAHYNGETFTFTVTLYNADGTIASINGTYGDLTFENGVATVTLANGESATATDLPAGLTYKVEEAADDNFSSEATGDSGMISAEESNADFTNTRKTGKLTVSKVVEGHYNGETFTFTVTLYEADGTVAKINGTYGDLTFENGVATITLANGESATATDLPVGLTYKVEEAADDNFTSEATGDNGTISEEESTAAFTNTHKTGDLTVSKTVDGVGGDQSKKFTFTITLSDTTINGTYGDMKFVNGVATITLAHGESATAKGLPTGITYTVAETADEEYTTDSTGATGTIEEDSTAEAKFINHKIPVPDEPSPETGDKSLASLVLMLIGSIGTIIAVSRKRRHKVM